MWRLIKSGSAVEIDECSRLALDVFPLSRLFGLHQNRLETAVRSWCGHTPLPCLSSLCYLTVNLLSNAIGTGLVGFDIAFDLAPLAESTRRAGAFSEVLHRTCQRLSRAMSDDTYAL